MKVLTLAAQKGGSGKSTIVCNIAAAAARDGERVVIIDIDPQRSSMSWGDRWGAMHSKGEITFRASEPAALHDLIYRIRQHGSTTIVIVDTPGIYGAAVGQALRDADLVVMPVKPSALDFETLAPLTDQLIKLGKPYAYVMSQCLPTSQARTIDTALALADMGPVCPVTIGMRTDFLDSAKVGMGVIEISPTGKAAQEIDALWSWIQKSMKEST